MTPNDDHTQTPATNDPWAFPILTRKRLDEITQEVIHNVIKSQIDTIEQSLLIEALDLVRTIQGAPKVRGRYKPALSTSTINHLGQKLQDYVAGMFASDDDVDAKELTDQNQNFPPQRQP